MFICIEQNTFQYENVIMIKKVDVILTAIRLLSNTKEIVILKL